MRFFLESAVKLRTFKSYSKLYCRACRELPSSPEAPGDRSYAIVRCACAFLHLEALAYLSFLDRQVGQGHDYEQQHHEQRGWHILRQLQCRQPGNGWNRRTSSYPGILGSWSCLARSHNFVMPGYSSCNRSCQPHGIFREAGAKGPMGPPQLCNASLAHAWTEASWEESVYSEKPLPLLRCPPCLGKQLSDATVVLQCDRH